jgi:hypothetical protein
MEHPGLTRAQRQTLDDRGLVCIPGAVPRKAAEAMADSIWRDMERRLGIRRRDRTTWRVERPADFNALSKSGAFKGMATAEVRGLLDDLLGRDGWIPPAYWGQPLVCFPKDYGRWDVPNQSWHLDLPADPKWFTTMKGRFFLVLETLAPRGGGTLVAEGSHRIVQDLADEGKVQLSSSAMRKHLKSEHRWFADLMSPTRNLDRIARFMAAPTEVKRVPMQVAEITGEPGDLWVMHPAALHAPAPNALDAPRMVLAQFVYPKKER